MAKVATDAQWQDLASRIKAKAEASAIPTTAADVNALPDTTKYAANLDFSINDTTFVITAQLKDQDGNNLGSAKTVDLPLESVVVDGDYDATTKEVVLTLKSGTEIRFSVADLVSGLQTEITSTNKLSADFVEGTTNNQFITQAEKSRLAGLDNYTLPIASDTVLGGVKVGSGLSINSTTGELTATGTSMKLYNATGQNTDGAMTQKAVTDNLPATFTTAEWNALWV